VRLKTPPYAKAHVKAAKMGFAPAGAIFVFDGWPMRRFAESQTEVWRALVPESDDPGQYDWRWVSGFPVLILAASPKRLIALGDALAAAEPSTLDCLLVTPAGPILGPWRKD
jgi:hypothetical protein